MGAFRVALIFAGDDEVLNLWGHLFVDYSLLAAAGGVSHLLVGVRHWLRLDILTSGNELGWWVAVEFHRGMACQRNLQGVLLIQDLFGLIFLSLPDRHIDSQLG